MADMTAGYLPTTADDATAQQNAARWFYLAGDIFRGADAIMRNEPGTDHSTGILGPIQSAPDVGIGVGGEIYYRGQAGQVGTQQAVPVNPLAGLLQSPLMLLLLVGGAIYLMKR